MVLVCQICNQINSCLSDFSDNISYLLSVSSDTTRMSKEQKDLGFLIMEVLSQLLSGNNKNSGKLCKYEMIPFILIFLQP